MKLDLPEPVDPAVARMIRLDYLLGVAWRIEPVDVAMITSIEYGQMIGKKDAAGKREIDVVWVSKEQAFTQQEQYWDDAIYTLPQGTASLRVSLYHQTTSREYIEFLRDENRTNDRGQIAHDVWTAQGKSAPVLMSQVEVAVDTAVCPQPIVYGLGNEASNGERARLGWSGTPSVTSGDFVVHLSGAVPGPGRLIVGQGSAHQAFQGGTLLVDRPRRAAVFTVAGDGTASIPVPLADHPDLVGRQVFLQAIFADPAGGAQASLSSALHIDVCQ